MNAPYKLIVQAGYFTGLIMLMLVGWTIYRYFDTLLPEPDSINRATQLSRTSERLLFLLKGAELEHRELIYHRDSTFLADSLYLTAYTKHLDSVDVCLNQLTNLLAGEGMPKSRRDSLSNLTLDQLTLMQHAIQLKAYNNSPAVQRFVLHRTTQPARTMAEIERLLTTIAKESDGRIHARAGGMQRVLLRARNSVLLLLLAYCGVAVVSLVFVYRTERKGQIHQQEVQQLKRELGQREEEAQTNNRELTDNRAELTTMYRQLEKLREEFASIVTARTAKIKRTNNRLIAEVIKRKRIGEALRKSEERFRIALDNAPIIVFNQDKDLRYTWMYDNTLASLGNREVIGKTDYDIFSPKDAEHMMLIKQHVLDSGKGTSQEIQLTRDHKKVYYLLTIEPLLNIQRQVVGITCASYDITQQKQAEDLLRDTLKELKRRNHELDNYVYKVSHDLRAPLVSILGLINLVKADDSPEAYKNYLGLIENRVNKLDDFVRSVLNHSRTLNSEIRIVAIDFEKIVEGCVEELRYLTALEKLKISVDVTGDTDFYSDDLRIGIVLKNFISNAVKYQNPFAGQSFLHFNIEVTEQQARIMIEDNGTGIEEQYLNRIFEMFFRGTSRSDGSGLGLYIVKQTIERLEGSVTVESEIGKGTRFRILLANFRGKAIG